MTKQEIAFAIDAHNHAVERFNVKPWSRTCPILTIDRGRAARKIAFVWGGAIVIFVTRDWLLRDPASHSKRSLLTPDNVVRSYVVEGA